MAHLGIGEKCTEKAKGSNININDLKEDVVSFSWPKGNVRCSEIFDTRCCFGEPKSRQCQFPLTPRFQRYAFASNYSLEERHTILDAMNNLADLVNSGSDGKKCISYTPYDPEKDVGMFLRK